jgi:hypothetical protein
LVVVIKKRHFCVEVYTGGPWRQISWPFCKVPFCVLWFFG